MIHSESETRHRDALPPPTRRGMSRIEAAAYISVSPGKFDQMVADGRMPAAWEIDKRLVWDRYKIDKALDLLPTRGKSTVETDQQDDGWSDYK